MKPKSYSLKLFTAEIVIVMIALLFLLPFYFVFANSFKGFTELLAYPLTAPAVIP